MERDTNQMSQSPSLCRSGCGFYGNPSSDGLCSKCYKDAVKRKQSAPTSSQHSQSSSSVNHSSAGRNSPISTPLMDSSANLPLLTTTFENTLNTASPTVPSAIIASAQELITKLEEMKRNQKNPKQKQNVSKKPKASDKQEITNAVQNNTQTLSETSDHQKSNEVSLQQISDSEKQNSIDSNTDQTVEQIEWIASAEESDQELDESDDEINQTDDSLGDGSENQDFSNQSNVVNNTTVESNSNGSSQTTPQSESNPPKTQKKKKNRCTKCKVNVGVIGFPCRCGGTFCSSHRYANEHNCTFDYREHGAEEIRKNNPQVIGEKVTKI